MKLALLAGVLMAPACKVSNYSTTPPGTSCASGEMWLDCLPGKWTGCGKGTHEYVCIDGRWKLWNQTEGKPGQSTMPVPVNPGNDNGEGSL